MASEEVVLVVGGDISLAELEAEVEVGESPRGNNANAEKPQEESSGDEPTLTAFQTQECVYCVYDENDLTAEACSMKADGTAISRSCTDSHVFKDHKEDASPDQDNSKTCERSLTNKSSCTETCHISQANCDKESQELPGETHKNVLSSPCNDLDSAKPEVHRAEQSMTGRRTCVTLNCDNQRLVSMVDTDQDCSENHILCKEMKEFTHINGLRHVMKEAWGKESHKCGEMLSSKVPHPRTHTNRISLTEDSLFDPSVCSREHDLSDPSSLDSDLSQSGDFSKCPDTEHKVVISGGSSTVQGVHRTVIDLQPAQIVHRNNLTLSEYSQSSAIESLPEEILLNIFSYLSPKELCHSVAPVCHRWHDLAYAPTLWMCLKIDPMWEVSSADICKILDRVSGVRVLSLWNRNGLTHSELAQYLRSCRLLTDLDLGLCDNVDMNVISCVLKYCTLLKRLNVEGCSSFDLECVKQISTLKHLTHLNLSHCRLENNSVDILASTLENIISFNVDGVSWITDEAIIPLCENHRSSLRHLELDGEELTDQSIKAVSECVGLRTLRVSFCDLLTDTSLDYLKDLKKLRKLRLRKGLEFSEEAVVKFFQHGHLNNVVDLDMSECAGMKDSSILALTQNCGRGLVSLALRWCWSVTDVGLISIVDHCSNLKSLDLTGLHRLSGECLDRVPEDMTHLTFLDLMNCNNINDKLIYEMIRCKPDLQVINYYGELFVYGETTS